MSAAAQSPVVRLKGQVMKWTETIKRRLGKLRRSNGVEAARFVPATENVHGVDLWDCAVFTSSMISVTSELSMASQFARLRASQGNEYRNQLPRDASASVCTLAYPVPQSFAEGPLFKASEMEDKWDVYFFDPHIYFVRSWSGQLIYRATVRFEDQHMAITGIECAGGHASEFGRRTVDYLVKSHVLGAVALHPLPDTLPADPMQVAVSSFATFGRRCAYGTYVDTTVLPWTTASGHQAGRSAV